MLSRIRDMSADVRHGTDAKPFARGRRPSDWRTLRQIAEFRIPDPSPAVTAQPGEHDFA
jgi:hypothetical protein